MQYAKKKCIIEGCNGQARSREYCGKHLKEQRQPKPITDLQRLTMRSQCCKAGCEHGKRHEYGEQYCAKCHEACQWKMAA